MTDERYIMSDARAQEIAERAAKKTLHDTFRLLGFDITEMTDLNNLRATISASSGSSAATLKRGGSKFSNPPQRPSSAHW